MSLFGMENFAFGDVADPFDATQTSLNLNVGDTGRFNVFPALATLTNITDFPNAHEAFVAGDAEIIEIVSKAGDMFNVIKRGQDGTTGIATTPGASYRVSVIATRAQWDLVCRAPADGSDSFDAILAGSPGVVAEAVARFVRSVSGEDCVFSIQGSDTNADSTALRLGFMSDPGRFRINLQRLTSGGVLDEIGVILNVIEFLTLQGRDRMGIGKGSPAQPLGIHVGKTIVFDKHVGFPQSDSTISGGQILAGVSNFIRVEAEGGPGSDDLDEILLLEKPEGSNRMILIIEPRTTAHDITVRDKFVAGGSANLNLKDTTSFVMSTQDDKIAFISRGTDNDEWVEIWRTPAALGPTNYCLLRDEKSSGTDGGTFTSGSWQTRDINTEVNDTDNLCSVGSNQIVLQPGTYRCNITAPGHAVLDHKIRLQNITGGTTTLVGSSEFADKSSTSRIRGLFTIGSATTFEVQHQSSSTQSTDGFGVASGFGVVEVYAIAEFQKVS